MDIRTAGIKPVIALMAVFLAWQATCGERGMCAAENRPSVSKPRLLVLVSRKAPPYEETLSSFREYLTGRVPAAGFDVCALDDDPSNVSEMVERAKREPASLVFALGAAATRMAAREFGAMPLVAGLVLNSDEIKGKANATGVFLDFPLEIQFQWIRRMLPDCRNVGVLYNPAGNVEKIEHAGKVAAGMGLTLHPRKVRTPSDLPYALDSLASRIDALWAVPDDLVYTPQTSRHILLFSFRNRIPLIGLSAEWVKAGALYSLEWDYRDLGIQCGEMALDLLKGPMPPSPPPKGPRKVEYALNLKTAQYMKIEIEEALVRNSRQVFR